LAAAIGLDEGMMNCFCARSELEARNELPVCDGERHYEITIDIFAVRLQHVWLGHFDNEIR
jgi:hypothetical protein